MSEIAPASPTAADMAVSARAALSARPLPTLPPELRNRTWGHIHAEDYPSTDRLCTDCKRVNHKNCERIAMFKAAFLKSNVRITPVVREEYLSLLWGSFKSIIFCNCNTQAKQTFNASFLHFSKHPGLFKVEYVIHSGTMGTMKDRYNTLHFIKIFVQALVQMRHKGTITLLGVQHETHLVKVGLCFLLALFRKGASIDEAIDKLEYAREWTDLLRKFGNYPVYFRTVFRSAYERPSRYERGEKDKDIAHYMRARDAALATGTPAPEAQKAGRAAMEAFRKSRPRVVVMDYGNPGGVMVKRDSVQVDWDLSGMKVGGGHLRGPPASKANITTRQT